MKLSLHINFKQFILRHARRVLLDPSHILYLCRSFCLLAGETESPIESNEKTNQISMLRGTTQHLGLKVEGSVQKHLCMFISETFSNVSNVQCGELYLCVCHCVVKLVCSLFIAIYRASTFLTLSL